MKVLMFGRGTIATIYGWALEKSGHQVEFYVRPGRAKHYGSEVNLTIRDGRVNRHGAPVDEAWPISIREDLDAAADYDLILLSVNHQQLDTAVELLSTRVGRATVLIFNNVWAEPTTVTAPLPREQLVWGFPGAGGGFIGNTLRGGVLKTVFLGSVDGSGETARHRTVRDLFRRAGFTVSEQRDFRSWLWFHFILDTALLAEGIKVGGPANLTRSRQAVEDSVLLVREMIPLLKAKGGTPRIGAAIASYVPAGLLSRLMQKFLSGNNLYSYVMDELADTGHGSLEMSSFFPKEVLADSRRLGVPLPRLATMEPLWQSAGTPG